MNKPLDRVYFKKKANPKAKKGPQLTECCGENKDRNGMNVKNKEDWILIETYIEQQLINYSATESVTPISCEICGRFLEYKSTLIDPKNKKGWNK